MWKYRIDWLVSLCVLIILKLIDKEFVSNAYEIIMFMNI